MNVDEFPEDSDTSDEDYIPTAKPEEVVSEVDSDGDPEDPLSDSEGSPKKKRRKTNKTSKSKKLRKEAPNPDDEEIEENSKINELTEEEKKKQADALWADFLQDTGFKSKSSASKANPSTISNKPIKSNTETIPKSETSKKADSDKVKITEIFEFAGEEVKVEKEVPKDSAEARLLGTSSCSNNTKVKKGGNLSGIGSVLSQIGKKKKISTLEKTKLDWDRFKKDENLEEELNNHNKGKDGYLERQDFLQRADLRRFEIEKEIRTVERNKRMNLGEPF
ncbi:craniofacial development protein 1 [Coccinella septempunctata]|uniref:craniofacial development protein 1 n=1 Tax=Coccinella septempunctata TaxID=41139 RepID=UPI001D09285B|nr:craniofacial development protein 1 [Coccinella septempunctata]